MFHVFSGHSVVFGLTVKNATQFKLEHVKSYCHYGAIDPGYDCPQVNNFTLFKNHISILFLQFIERESEAGLIARNPSRTPAGTSGVAVWKILPTKFHLSVAWCAPWNFYTHSNCLAFSITNGEPVEIDESGYGKYFNKLYYNEVSQRANLLVQTSFDSLF